ncbi:filamentous hemagglutinin N-terminal domain-containing protein [Telluria mixta]|uniref:Filamentous hemagglutinin N-terminal domain-containing protein n=1 Tax=Telluria mixta TaxID=34071 RepID=A0ABT2CAX7_9BURK|nr:filamentous hemagglutinin N-terminal domain-containing protein [Telluria mixta]MCS0633814.1 filamentous hemagglutinin N-terminal domain-containing protein [Telluria mixta]WEM93180.1 filamentous hemagglutinin N-terminal domain-containing protein [Telluria mixta]
MTSSIQRRLGALLLAACYCATGSAAPTLPQVVAGQATFNQQGNVFSITNTPGAIINWQSFNIGAGEVARFIQQNADSAVLNRVLGQDPSKILGALQSNGKVFLINPNGILFGQGARVDVNGLVASTLNISDADFQAGRKRFQAGAKERNEGTVRNEGTIATPSGGQVFLIAPHVENTGLVTAPNGDVILAAGHSVQLVDSNDPDLRVELAAPAGQAVNLGQVIAQGGRIGIYGALVNQRGVVNADSAVMGANGRVVLKASRAVALDAGSVTRAAGNAGADGGTVQVLGQQVDIAAGAGVDASGRNGGTVLVGGDWQGGGKVMRAQNTSVAHGAVIRADGSAGNGGKVVLWSDGATAAHGVVSARGSAAGGKVETSGHALDVDGIAVDASGSKGRNGTWLLDPYDIEVVAGGTANANDVKTSTGGTSTGVTRVAPATLTAAGTDVILQAQHDLTVTDALDATGSVRAQAGNDIRVNAQVSAGGDLDFRAQNAFTLGANGLLKTGNYIDISANQITLAGSIAGSGQLPILTLTSADPGRAISIGSGTGSKGALALDASSLQRLSGNLFEINVGNSAHTGTVSVDSALTAATNVVLENAGDIHIGAPVDLSANAASRFIASQYASGGLIDVAGTVKAAKSVLLQGDRLAIGATVSAGGVKLQPNSAGTHMVIGGTSAGDGFTLGQAALSNVQTADLTIGGLAGGWGGIDVDGAASFAGAKLTLDAGNGELAIKAPLSATGTLALTSNLGIYERDTGIVKAGNVALRGGQVVFTGANVIGTLSGSASGNLFHVVNQGGLRIGTVDGMSGIAAPNASVQFVSGGLLMLDAGIAGGADATLDAAGIAGSGLLQAGTLALKSSAGIGTTTTPLNTRTGTLTASNQGTGSLPINVANDGPLLLRRAVQDGQGNGGAIVVDSVGGMTVPAFDVTDGAGEVRTNSGDISLTTHSPLTIHGRVATTSGNVRLLADNGGAVTISSSARVMSVSGNVSVTGGSTEIAADSISVSSPDKLQVNTNGTGTPTPNPTPTLDACLANRTTAGCAPVLAAAVQACTANPSGPRCGEILPTYETCSAQPTAPGCAPIIKEHDAITACMADPKAPGCATTLPVYDVCKTAPSTYGCSVVIKEHDAISACIADPKAPGCTTTLPPLDQCRADGSAYGCAAVLARARFDACLANPSGAGCGDVLPKLDVCKLTPSLEGCTQVLALGFQACLANPHDPGCSGILPTLTQCQGNSKLPGCEVVLPTLAQCIGSPSLQGCDVRLPSLAVCAAAPSTAGCEAVLPTASFCSTHPGDAVCVVFGGGTGTGQNAQGTPVAQAVQTVVQLINTSTPTIAGSGAGKSDKDAAAGKPAERLSGLAQVEQSGVKNEKPATKTYCN